MECMRHTPLPASAHVHQCTHKTQVASLVWLHGAGADGGKSLVVMSKGTKFTQQSYKVPISARSWPLCRVPPHCT